MIKGTKCQTENPDSDRFCADCGQPLQVGLVYSRCLNLNKPRANPSGKCGEPLGRPQALQPPPAARPSPPTTPTFFTGGRYQFKKSLGEGEMTVYLTHDTVLDRSMALALMRTEKLGDVARTHIKPEARATGRPRDGHNAVTVFDFGEHECRACGLAATAVWPRARPHQERQRAPSIRLAEAPTTTSFCECSTRALSLVVGGR